MDDDYRGPSISSEDVKVSEADKHVESGDKPESRRKTRLLLLGTAVGTGLLAFMLGLGLGLGISALATPDQVRGKPSVETRQVPSYSLPIGTGAPAPVGVIPTPDQIKLEVIVLSQKCFGSAGCVVTIRIHPTYTGSSPLAGAFTVVYTVTGDENGPVTDYFTVDKDGNAHLTGDVIETPSPDTTITAVVTRILRG